MLFQYYPSPNPHSFKYELNKDMNFSSAHFIPDERAGACSRIHGHGYVCNLTIVGNELDELGFLVNFSDLKKVVHKRFDHDLINNVIDDIPSTELVAKNIYEMVSDYLKTQPNNPKCIQVILRETYSSYVIYRPQS